jgi:type I restriction enzyme S subunit
MWKYIPFEKCLDKTKITFKLPKKHYKESGEYPIVSQEANLISGYHDDISYPFKVSKPVIVFGDHTRALKYIDFDFIVGADGVKILLPVKEIDSKYFYYVLTAFMPKTTGYARHYKLLKKLDIPVPSLAEQQRIVAKLDAAFAEIDRAVETTSEHLKSIKQLFLTSLDTLVNADDLGESKPLGEICELAQGLAINKGTKHLLVRNSSKPLIRIKDLVNETEEQFITDEYENTKTEVNEEDLIFTRTGSLGLVFRGRKGVLHNNSFKVTPSQGLSRDYLYWWLKNPSFLNIIHRISGKAAQPDISHKLFKAQQIKIPTAVKQKDIVAKIELLFEQTEKMKRINLYKLHQIHTLKSAMLSQELQSSEAA